MKHWFIIIGIILFAFGCQQNDSASLLPIAEPIRDVWPNQLIVVDYPAVNQAEIKRIDAVTGEQTLLWQAPDKSWIHQLSAINAETVGLSYSPVPAPEETPYLQASIYALSLDSEIPTLTPLIESEREREFLYNPVWTPDGRYIFYVRYWIDGEFPDVMLMRYDIESEEKMEFAKDGIWPRISAENNLITYINVNPDTQDRGLVVSDWDGNNATQLVRIGEYYDIDSPLFSADSSHIYFTASLAGRKVGWLDWLLGVKVAFAHADANVPVEWMRVAVEGGDHEQLSAENEPILYGDLNGAGDTLYFSTLSGMYSMPVTGGSYTSVMSEPTVRTFVGQVAAP